MRKLRHIEIEELMRLVSDRLGIPIQVSLILNPETAGRKGETGRHIRPMLLPRFVQSRRKPSTRKRVYWAGRNPGEGPTRPTHSHSLPQIDKLRPGV